MPPKRPDVREHIPLEQGLRLLVQGIFRSRTPSQRAYSIRTRIKTINEPFWQNITKCQRAYSIRTRIKTKKNLIGTKKT